MPFTVSPNIDVSGKNLKAFSTNVTDVVAGFVGRFDWGPTTDNVVISSEGELYSTYGAPEASATGGMDWWTASNFLSYGNAVTCRRSITYADNASRGVAHGFSGGHGNTFATGGFEGHIDAVADIESLYSGKLANNLRVAIIGPTDFDSGPTSAAMGTTLGVFNPYNYGYIPSTTAFAEARGVTNDELHIGVVSGKSDTALGNADEILEVYTGLSRFKNAKAIDGSNIYYKDYVNNNSNYIRFNGELFTDTDQTISDTSEENAGVDIAKWAEIGGAGYTSGWFNGITANPGSTGVVRYAAVASGTGGVTGNVAVTFLSSGANATNWYAGRSGSYSTAFADPEQSDIDIIIAGENDNDTNKKVAAIALDRKDCIAFISPTSSNATTFHVTNDSTPTTTIAAAKTAREDIGDNSYVVMDSGYKYMYDNRSDVGRWIPMNSDTAGIVARTTNTNDPWFSPGGLNRGRLNNVIKLSLNPTRTQRDTLYASQINPITVFPGEGAVLFGDRTLQSRPSAFDRIHVRRLFNVLEKQIATAAKLQLFEFNDTFTRRSFVNLVEPFLRSVQARNGIESFSIVCDDTNNDANAVKDGIFKADIFIKPLNAINVVALNFTAQSNTAAFSENIASNRVSRTELSGF